MNSFAGGGLARTLNIPSENNKTTTFKTKPANNNQGYVYAYFF